ncbi:MAG TPA: hypothetical protein VJ372_25865 [Pyrinomonadaceae bacterium]|nr:hypothetical protein [Pyrinomonadaceae bacterium]
MQILTEVRRQIVGQSDITQNLGSMSPGDATAIMQQQQVRYSKPSIVEFRIY